MQIFLLVQEIQNQHGYVDTSIIDAYSDKSNAERALTSLEDTDLEAGENVHGREEDWKTNDDEAEWTVNYLVQEVTLYRAPRTSVESQVYIDTGELPVVKEVR